MCQPTGSDNATALTRHGLIMPVGPTSRRRVMHRPDGGGAALYPPLGDYTLSIVRPDRFRFSSILRRWNNGQHGFDRFLPGINVGGHRAFRPSVLAKELGIYDAVNVGAAGTLVIRKPGLRAKFLAELRRKLPFEATIASCEGSDLIRLEMDDPFGTEPPRADVVQFVSILSEAGRRRVSLPIALPEGGEWLVRIIGSKNRLVYGVYRHHMKTIGYLGQIDRLFGVPATTRSWNTILSVLRI